MSVNTPRKGTSSMSAITTRTSSTSAKPKTESIVNDAPRLFIEADFEVGTVAHQGDIMIVRIAELPPSAKPRKSRQLADGTTQGSRHVLNRGNVYDCDAADVATAIEKANRCRIEPRYVGPVFTSPAKPTADDLTHPEHGNQGFPAGAVCAVVYQRNLDAEDREARVAD